MFVFYFSVNMQKELVSIANLIRDIYRLEIQ